MTMGTKTKRRANATIVFLYLMILFLPFLFSHTKRLARLFGTTVVHLTSQFVDGVFLSSNERGRLRSPVSRQATGFVYGRVIGRDRFFALSYYQFCSRTVFVFCNGVSAGGVSFCSQRDKRVDICAYDILLRNILFCSFSRYL